MCSLDASGRAQFTQAAEWGKWSHLDALVFPDDVFVVAEDLAAGQIAAGASDEVAMQAVGFGLAPVGGAALGLGAGRCRRLSGWSIKPSVDNADAVLKFGGGGDHESVVTGTTDPGSSVTLQQGNTLVNATVAPDGSWTATFDATAIPSGEYDAVLGATTTDPAGNVSTINESVRVDTVAGDLALSPLSIEVDDVITAVETTDGVIVCGAATPGMTVSVSPDGVTTTALSDPSGNWSALYSPSQIAPGTHEATITASISDQYGNTKTVTDTVQVDTLVENLAVSQPVAEDGLISDQGFGFGTAANLKVVEVMREAGTRRVAQAQEDADRRIAAAEQKLAALTASATRSADLAAQARANTQLFQRQFNVGTRTVMDVVGVVENLARLDQDHSAIRHQIAQAQLEIARERGVLANGSDV